MPNVENKILNFIKVNKLINRNDSILLGISGGPDSVFAFHFLNKYKNKLGIRFQAAHINHKLRGKESDADEQFCRKLCREHNVEFHSKRIKINKRTGRAAKSIEEAAREVRYVFFTECSLKNNLNKIFTAHNMDDNTETVLLNLIKGCSFYSLSGIPLSRDNIIRPLLSVNKEEILTYLDEHGINFRTDKTNLQSDFERNFLRNELLPNIKNKLNPKFNEAVFRNSESVRNFQELFRVQISELDKNLVKRSNSEYIFHLELFKLNEFISGEILKKIFVNELNTEFNSKIQRSLLDLAASQVGKEINLKSQLTALRERNSVIILKKGLSKNKKFSFSIGESIKTDDFELNSKILKDKRGKSSAKNNTEYISADNLGDLFILRKWKEGDKFIPLGMRGRKNVSDFLTDQKIPNKKRNSVYVLENRNQIVWIVGLRISDIFKVQKSTQRICKLWLS